MADPAHLEGGADLHGPIGHMDRGPKLVLVPVRILKLYGGPLVSFGRYRDGLGVGDAMSVEPSQMLVDFLGPDEETKSGQVFAQSFTRRIYLWLKKGAEAARSILEGKKAVYRGIPFAGRGRKLSNGLAGNPCGVQRPFDPGGHIVGPHYEMIDPVCCSPGFFVCHVFSPFVN